MMSRQIDREGGDDSENDWEVGQLPVESQLDSLSSFDRF
jgi:hypothetical protein